MNPLQTSEAGSDRPLAVSLDMAGDPYAAAEWVRLVLPGAAIRSLDKAELKWQSWPKALARLRSLRPGVFAAVTSDLATQSGRGRLMLLGALAGARMIVIGDCRRYITRSRLAAFCLEGPRVALELLTGYGFISPLSGLLTMALRALVWLRNLIRVSRRIKPLRPDELGYSFIYIRANISTLREGGMPTHVEGLLHAAIALGHRPILIECAVPGGPPGQQQNPGHCQGTPADRILIAPSTAVSVTKELLHLWNNLVFTARAFAALTAQMRSGTAVDFIYQRYSRFNWTGVALSVATGLPLILEYNSSEVWVARHWNPVGGLRLLKLFERLNQRAADLIVAVSEVGKDDLIQAGIPASRIIVNPNGVDTDVFTPGCGGAAVRRALGVDDEILVAFVGTFGPWHGATVLARAALLVRPSERYHFLFIGAGEQRPSAESILRQSDRAPGSTFAGWVAHDRIPAYLDACDVLVSPQVESVGGGGFFGSPTKLFEYMAMARPVVASRIGQMCDVIVDGRNGLLVDPGDPMALARAIERLAGDETARNRIGAAARQTAVQSYTWRHNAERVFVAARRIL